MHALASQGRLKDVSRDLVHDYQRTSCSLALPELSVTGSAAGAADRTSSVDSYVDYVTSRRSTAEDAAWLKETQTSKSSAALLPPAPLQRLEQLESELASLNHARRRLAVDDDLGPAAASSAAVTEPKTERGQGDVSQPVDQARNDYAAAAGGGDASISPWMSASFREVAALHRRQMCGGSVYSASTTAVNNCLQSPSPMTSSSYPAPAVDVVSSLARLTSSRYQVDDGAPSPSKWYGVSTAAIEARTASTDSNEAATSAFPRTPAKQEPSSPRPYSAAEHPPTSLNGINRFESHYTLGMYARSMPTFYSYYTIAPFVIVTLNDFR